MTIDTLNPTLALDIVDASLNDGDNSSLVTFEFSEDVTGFDNSDVNVSGGTLSDFTQVDGNSYTAIFTATDAVETTGSVSVAAASYRISVQSNNNLLIGSAYTKKMGLKPGDEFEITSIKDIISQNVKGLVGMLPSEDFAVQITTDRENLANLLASAMMTGYFLGQVEKRHHLESILLATESIKWSIYRFYAI